MYCIVLLLYISSSIYVSTKLPPYSIYSTRHIERRCGCAEIVSNEISSPRSRRKLRRSLRNIVLAFSHNTSDSPRNPLKTLTYPRPIYRLPLLVKTLDRPSRRRQITKARCRSRLSRESERWPLTTRCLGSSISLASPLRQGQKRPSHQ